MNAGKFIGLVILLLLTPQVDSQEILSSNEILLKILEKAEENDKRLGNKGFFLDSTSRKLEESGKVKGEETRTYRTVWIQNYMYTELIRINGKELDSKRRSEEEKRKKDFLKKFNQKEKEESKEEFTWKELYDKYDFTQFPAEEGAPYVFTFQPRKGELQERSRTEKIVNHLRGKFWADEEFNLVRIEATLADPVRFGLGIVAKLDRLDVEYTQQKFGEDWVPGTLRYKFYARIALVRAERQESILRFYDFFSREAGPPQAAGPQS